MGKSDAVDRGGTRIKSEDPLYRSNKPLWNATLAAKRESERLVAELLEKGFKVPTINNGHK